MKDVAGKREDVDKLDRLGTQLKYFSQKKDVIVIKNMLVNVQNRYQRVGSRCNEKTRELESGMKLAKQVNVALSCLVSFTNLLHKKIICYT